MDWLPRIWVLTDDRTGHNAQSMGLAEALGLPYETKPLQYRPLAHLPSGWFTHNLHSLRTESQALIAPPWPDMVIACGRRLVPVMRHIHHHSPSSWLIQSMWPGRMEPFNRIIVPEHDLVPDDPRILRTYGAFHSLTQSAIEQAANQLRAQTHHLRHPIVGMLIGGTTKQGNMSHAESAALADLAELLVGPEGSLAITTSRRTPRYVASIIEDRLTCPHWLYRYGSAAPNPYLGILGLADALIVTGDSISMLSEACFTGKPVFIAETHSAMRDKHHRFIRYLYQHGYAQPLTPESDLRAGTSKSLDERQNLVASLKEDLKKVAKHSK